MDDQRRVLTPAEAIKLGANYLVIGRPITGAEDPVAVAMLVIGEIKGVLLSLPASQAQE